MMRAAAVAACAVVLAGCGLPLLPHQRPPESAPAPPPSEVRAETIHLCTAWAVAYTALPVPQDAKDLLTAAAYTQAALRRDVVADPAVRAALVDQAASMADQAAVLAHVTPGGAVQVPTSWSGAVALDGAAWHACHDWGG